MHLAAQAVSVLMSNPTPLIIDDGDPQLEYSGNWTFNENWQGTFDQTTHWTKTAGSTLTFTFTGACVEGASQVLEG